MRVGAVPFTSFKSWNGINTGGSLQRDNKRLPSVENIGQYFSHLRDHLTHRVTIFFLKDFVFSYMYVYVPMKDVPKNVSSVRSLKLELEAVVSQLTWMLI